MAAARSSPVSKMVLDIVARLRDIGAELARKSTRSPSALALASLPPVIPAAAAAAAPDATALRPSEPEALDPISSSARQAATGGGELLQPGEEPNGEVAEADGDETPSEDQDEDSTGDATSTSGNQDELEAEEDGGAGVDDEEEEEGGEMDPKCKLEDCSDLKLDNGNSNHLDNNQQQQTGNGNSANSYGEQVAIAQVDASKILANYPIKYGPDGLPQMPPPSSPTNPQQDLLNNDLYPADNPYNSELHNRVPSSSSGPSRFFTFASTSTSTGAATMLCFSCTTSNHQLAIVHLLLGLLLARRQLIAFV